MRFCSADAEAGGLTDAELARTSDSRRDLRLGHVDTGHGGTPPDQVERYGPGPGRDVEHLGSVETDEPLEAIVDLGRGSVAVHGVVPASPTVVEGRGHDAATEPKAEPDFIRPSGRPGRRTGSCRSTRFGT